MTFRITELWIGQVIFTNNKIWNSKSMRRELVTRILQQMTHKYEPHFFKLVFQIENVNDIITCEINSMQKDWLESLAEFERI